MIVRYKCKDSKSAIMLVSEVEKVGTACYFHPVNPDLYSIVIDPISDDCYDSIVLDLYSNGKVDVTNHYYRTYEDVEEEDPIDYISREKCKGDVK